MVTIRDISPVHIILSRNVRTGFGGIITKLSREYLTRIFAYIFVWEQDWPNALRFYIFWPQIQFLKKTHKKKQKQKNKNKQTKKKKKIFVSVKALYFRTFETHVFVKLLRSPSKAAPHIFKEYN